MQTTHQKSFSVAAQYKKIIEAAKLNPSPKQQPSRPRQIFEVFTVLFALFMFPDIANAGMSSASIGASVEFHRYEVVKMLDQHFTVEMEQDAKNSYQMETDEDGRNILLIQ